MALFIDHQAVERALDWRTCIDLLETASRHEADGNTFVSPKFNSDFRQGFMRILFAADYAAGYGATKAYHTIEGVGTRYLVSLIDLGSGSLLALVDGRPVTDLRTGAASGVVARMVPIDGPVTVGVLGSGHQAKAQLHTLAAVYPLAGATVFSPTAQNRAAFADEMSAALGTPVKAVASAEEAVRGHNVVVAATKWRSAEPAFRRDWLDRCRLLCAVGNTRAQFVEIDPACLADARLAIVDSLHAFDEAGELIAAAKAGLLPAEKRSTLAKLVTGQVQVPPDGLIVFKSVGTALQDLALAGHCYERLRGEAPGSALPDLLCS